MDLVKLWNIPAYTFVYIYINPRRKWLLFYVIIHLGHSERNHQIHVHQTLSVGDLNLIYAHPPFGVRMIRDVGV